MTDTTAPPRPLVQVGPTSLPDNSDVTQWTPQQKAIVDAAGLVFTFPDYHDRAGERVPASPAVVEKFLAICRRTGLDPLARQVYCIGRASKNAVEWSIQTGIDGFRVVADRSGKYAGQDPFEWLTAEHGWVDVFVPVIHGPHPLAARARIYRSDWPADRPAVAVAEWSAYVQTKRNGDPVAMWAQNGAGQLAKCAEALGLRKAFPQDLSGVYTDDETASTANTPEPVEPTRDWLADIAKLRDMDAAAIMREELRLAPDYSPELWGALLAKVGTLQTESKPRAEDVYEADGSSAAPDGQNQGQDDPAPEPRDDAPSNQPDAAEGRTAPQPDDDVIVAEVMTDEPTSDEDREAAEEAAFDQHYADMAYDPELENLDQQIVREYGVEAARSAAALHAKAQQQTKRPGFNSSAMGGTK
jgi:phage recombination protein Bet